ncbi:MAG: dicarboxylate/amino acid:cation symporter [Gemmatimonas sp.]
MSDVSPRRSPLASQGLQVTLGLIGGLALGMVLSQQATPSAFTGGLLATLEVIGTAWINAVRMTVIPLVVPLLIVGVAGGDDLRATGTVGAKAFGWMLVLLVACALFSSVASSVWFDALVLDPAATTRLRESAKIDVPSSDALSVRTFILSLIPLNPIKAAADGTLLPVVLFTLLYAFALGKVQDAPRGAQLAFFRGMADTMLIVVQWMLALGGIGIFALATVLGQKLGTNVLGAIGFYFVVNIVLHLVATAGIYVAVAFSGRVSVRDFARALVPASVVGMGSRSSLASLPDHGEGRDRCAASTAHGHRVRPTVVRECLQAHERRVLGDRCALHCEAVRHRSQHGQPRARGGIECGAELQHAGHPQRRHAAAGATLCQHRIAGGGHWYSHCARYTPRHVQDAAERDGGHVRGGHDGEPQQG